MIAAGMFIFGVVCGITLLAICLAWDSQSESLSERHDRLDAEAAEGWSA